MKRVKLFILIFIFCFIFGFIYAFADNNFLLTAPSSVVQGKTFNIVYTIKSAETPSLQAPVIDGCILMNGPTTSTATYTKVVNGIKTSGIEQTLTFTYQASTPGVYSIPASTISFNGTTHSVPAKTLTVTSSNQNEQISANESETEKVANNNNTFILPVLSKSTVYKQEAVKLSVKLYTKSYAIKNFTEKSAPKFSNFVFENIPLSDRRLTIENYNGQNYYTTTLYQYILYPQNSGDLKIETGTYEGVVVDNAYDGAGGYAASTPTEKSITLAPVSISLNVRDFPSPIPFPFKGAVGNFNISSKLSDKKILVGDTATYTVTIKGTGNLKSMPAPQIVFPKELKSLPIISEPSYRPTDSNLTGEIIYMLKFIPQKDGEYIIPDWQFSYFDPAARAYKTVKINSSIINVIENSSTTDVLSNTGNDDNEQNGSKLSTLSIILIILWSVIIIAVGICLIIAKHNKSSQKDFQDTK